MAPLSRIGKCFVVFARVFTQSRVTAVFTAAYALTQLPDSWRRFAVVARPVWDGVSFHGRVRLVNRTGLCGL